MRLASLLALSAALLLVGGCGLVLDTAPADPRPDSGPAPGCTDDAQCDDGNVCNGIEACAQGLGPGQFLSYMVAPLVRAGRLRYVLEAFEREPLPVHLVWPQARRVSPALRAFVDLCVERLRATPLD